MRLRHLFGIWSVRDEELVLGHLRACGRTRSVVLKRLFGMRGVPFYRMMASLQSRGQVEQFRQTEVVHGHSVELCYFRLPFGGKS